MSTRLCERKGETEPQREEANRMARNQAEIRKTNEVNEERRKRPECFIHDADQRIKLRFFFCLESEGKKKLLRSHAHVDIATINFRDFYNHCETLFKKDKKYIIEKINLYNTQESDRESLETFFLRLSGQAAQCGWAIDNKKEVVRDIFIAKMRSKDIQRDLCIKPLPLSCKNKWVSQHRLT